MVMFPDSIANVLLADNPWIEGADPVEWASRRIPSPFVERTTGVTLDSERVTLVVGPRQAGKSTLIWKTILGDAAPCLYVNCEEPSMADGLTSPALFLQGLDGLVPRGTTVFFEEIQRLGEAGLFLKGLVDRKPPYRFVATGSSSYDLDARTRESLAGRADRTLLLPLSLAEISPTRGVPPLIARQRQGDAARAMALHGGYPAVHLGPNKEAALTGLVESFVIRDASDRFRIRHTASFRTLLELMASQIGNLCNFSKWAEVAGISADTVRDYADILGETHIVRLVRPFAGGKRAEITSAPKVYFVDNGIRNRLFGGFAPLGGRADRGALVENLAFAELLKCTNPLLDGIRFWRSKGGAEVDFVIERGGDLFGLEITAGRIDRGLSRGARGFIETYSPRRFWLIGGGDGEGFRLGETEVGFARVGDLRRLLGGA
jgi:hypothetical protein